MRALRRLDLRTLPARLRRSKSGLALTEFAFSLPVLLALGLYGFETANLAIGHMRISNMAMLTADNAARVRESATRAGSARHRWPPSPAGGAGAPHDRHGIFPDRAGRTKAGRPVMNQP